MRSTCPTPPRRPGARRRASRCGPPGGGDPEAARAPRPAAVGGGRWSRARRRPVRPGTRHGTSRSSRGQPRRDDAATSPASSRSRADYRRGSRDGRARSARSTDPRPRSTRSSPSTAAHPDAPLYCSRACTSRREPGAGPTPGGDRAFAAESTSRRRGARRLGARRAAAARRAAGRRTSARGSPAGSSGWSGIRTGSTAPTGGTRRAPRGPVLPQHRGRDAHRAWLAALDRLATLEPPRRLDAARLHELADDRSAPAPAEPLPRRTWRGRRQPRPRAWGGTFDTRYPYYPFQRRPPCRRVGVDPYAGTWALRDTTGTGDGHRVRAVLPRLGPVRSARPGRASEQEDADRRDPAPDPRAGLAGSLLVGRRVVQVPWNTAPAAPRASVAEGNDSGWAGGACARGRVREGDDRGPPHMPEGSAG